MVSQLSIFTWCLVSFKHLILPCLASLLTQQSNSVVVASIFRIVAVTQIDPMDFSFTNVGGGLWSTVEVEVGFICANLPAVRPLLFKWFGYENSRNASGATPKYNLSSKGGMLSGHIKLQSRNRDNDLDNSSTEILSPEDGTHGIALTSTNNTKSNAHGGDKAEPGSLSDIVVQTDFNMSIDPNPESSAGGKTDHFVQITTANNRVRLQGAANDYYGKRD